MRLHSGKSTDPRDKIKNGIRLIIALIAAVFIFTGCTAQDFPLFGKREPSFDEKGALKTKVIRVKDGDTFVVKLQGVKETVRLIGIDAPESVHPDSMKNSEQGEMVSEYVSKLITGRTVFLEMDASERDRYGRILAYCWLDENTMLNALLLEKGYATVMTVQPNVRYQDYFLRLQKKARDEGRGYWKDYFKETYDDKDS